MNGADAEAFGPQFQRMLVKGCMGDPKLSRIVRKFINADQLGWTDPAALWAWRLIEDCETVSPLMLQTEARRLAPDDPAKTGAESIILDNRDFRDSKWVREKIIEWAKKQTFRLAFEEARELYNTGDIGAAQTKMMGRLDEMNDMSIGAADRGWFFEDFDVRQHRRMTFSDSTQRFPSGIRALDEAMQGGLSRGELEIPLAYSGIGKTFWCVQRGFLGVRMRRRVLHLALEGGRAGTEDRYEARFMRETYQNIRTGNIDPQTLAAVMHEYDLLQHSGLVIRSWGDEEKAWETTYADILTELRELRQQRGWVPDLIVVDYGDLLMSEGENEYIRQKMSYRQLKALSERIEYPGHPGYAVVSPSQAQRPAKDSDTREHVLKPRDVADCYEKVRVADVVLSLNRTADEKEAGIARVHLGKYRHAEDGLTVRVSTDYAQGGFSVINGEEPPPLEPKAGGSQQPQRPQRLAVPGQRAAPPSYVPKVGPQPAPSTPSVLGPPRA